MGMVSGVADMCYLTRSGKPIFIELKVADNDQSDNQIWWQSVVESVGIDYFIVKSFDEFKKVLLDSQR